MSTPSSPSPADPVGGGSAAPSAVAADDAATTPAGGEPRRRGRGAHKQRKGSFWRELPVLLVIAFGLALLIKAFLVQAFFIPSGSMEQTLLVDDRVLVNKLVYKTREVHRGEVVVFSGVGNWQQEVVIPEPDNAVERARRFLARAIGLGAPSDRDFIKRVIGVEGDRVACCSNGHVTVQPKGSDRPVELVEPYVFEDNNEPFCEAGLGEAACPPGAPGVLVPEGRLWVMGDHRSASADSRAHITDAHKGTVPVDKVIGRAFVVVWPFERAKVLRVPETFDNALGPAAGVAVSATPLLLGLAGAYPLRAAGRRVVRVAARRRSGD